MAATLFQGTLGSSLTYSAFGGAGSSIGPSGPPPGSWSAHRISGGDSQVAAPGETSGATGGGLNEASEQEAISGAMSDCTGQGGTDCKFIGVVKNQCIAVAIGTTQFATSAGQTQMTAEKQAVSKCAASGSTGCKAHYSTCTEIAYGN